VTQLQVVQVDDASSSSVNVGLDGRGNALTGPDASQAEVDRLVEHAGLYLVILFLEAAHNKVIS
jgi:RNase adaptor protein for sRNA GlmZ degradation